MTKRELQDLIFDLLDLIHSKKEIKQMLQDSKVVYIAKAEVNYLED